MKEQEILHWINNGNKDEKKAFVWFNMKRTLALYLMRGSQVAPFTYGILNFLELPQSKRRIISFGRPLAFLKDLLMDLTDKEHYREYIGQFIENEDIEPEEWPSERVDLLFEYLRMSEIAKENEKNPFLGVGPQNTVTDWRGTIHDAIFVNMGVSLRTGGRKAPRLTETEFKDALEKKKANHKKALDEFSWTTNEPGYLNHWILDLGTELDWKWVKDVQKVQFDFENCGISDDIKVSPRKGIPYLECWAGGDWQYPVNFFLYWDGKDIRGYVPTKGNTFNATLSCAFGEEQEFLPVDQDQWGEEEWKKTGTYVVISQNFPDYLVGKTAKEVSESSYNVMERLRPNMDAMLEDFEERVDVV